MGAYLTLLLDNIARLACREMPAPASSPSANFGTLAQRHTSPFRLIHLGPSHGDPVFAISSPFVETPAHPYDFLITLAVLAFATGPYLVS